MDKRRIWTTVCTVLLMFGVWCMFTNLNNQNAFIKRMVADISQNYIWQYDGTMYKNKQLEKPKHINLSQYLSFLEHYTPSCNSIFKSNEDKQTKMNEFSNIVQQLEEYDKLVKEEMKRIPGSKCTEGYTFKYIEEVYLMLKLVQADFVKTVCETGFNAGHSALLWLLLRPDIKVYSFDINRWTCTSTQSKYLLDKYPDRLEIIFGDSTETLPVFQKERPDVICDVAIVDGGHTKPVADADITNFYNMTRDTNFVFMDNYPDKRYGLELSYGWEKAKRHGIISELFRCAYKETSGFTFGRYIH